MLAASFGLEFSLVMGRATDREFHAGSGCICVGGEIYRVAQTSANTFLIPLGGYVRSIRESDGTERPSMTYSQRNVAAFQEEMAPLLILGAYYATGWVDW